MGTAKKGRPPEIQPNYIVGQDWDFGWEFPRHYEELKHMWLEGLGYQEIARAFGRPQTETVCFIMDQWERGKLPDRDNGICGRRRGA